MNNPETIGDARRILVIGSPGAGKTTFAKRLAKETGLPVVHLDHLLWRPGWVLHTDEVYRARLKDALEQDHWVIDGNHLRTLPDRLARANKVYFLDVPWYICTYRIIKRWLLRQGFQAEGCPQKIDLEFLKFVSWDFPLRERKKVVELLDGFAGDLIFVRRKNQRI